MLTFPKNPNGLTNLAGNENLIAVKIVLSNPSQSPIKKGNSACSST